MLREWAGGTALTSSDESFLGIALKNNKKINRSPAVLRRQPGCLCSALKLWLRVVSEHHRAEPAAGTGRAPAALPSEGRAGRAGAGLPLPARPPAATATRAAGAAGTECVPVSVCPCVGGAGLRVTFAVA